MNGNNLDSSLPPATEREEKLPWEAMLAYVPLFCLYPWSIKHTIPGLEAHSRQGMILFGIELFLLLSQVAAFYKLLWLAVAVLAGLGIWSVYRGQAYRLPLVADIADRLVEDQAKKGRD